MLKLILKILLFSAGLLLLNDRLTEVFAPKRFPVSVPNINTMTDVNWFSTMRNGLYNEKKDSLDAVFIGSSQVFCDINPNLIWDMYGITSCDFSANVQDPGTSYYYLKQVFESQSPKVAVVDLYLSGVKTFNDFGEEAGNIFAHYNFDYMKKDLNRARAIWTRAARSRLELFFPITVYHQGWKELTKNDLFMDPKKHDVLKGSVIFMNNYYGEENFAEIPDELPEYSLPDETVYWLNAIQKLCREHDCECLFIKTPVLPAAYDEYTEMSGTEYAAYLDALEKYCRENQFAFLNVNDYNESIGFDRETDFIDDLHLNWNGQQKLAAFLGNYLQENYRIENKKGMPGYEQWDRDLDRMYEYIDHFRALYFGNTPEGQAAED